MRLEKRKDTWRVLVEATCPNCREQFERVLPVNRRLNQVTPCPRCKHGVDRVYFD